jgi:hypothetical protein
MTVETEPGYEEVPETMPERAPRQQPPPPAPDVQSLGPPPAPADGTDKPVRRTVQRRPPLARGTVAIGGTAVVGTLLAVVGFGAGAMALVATAAGTVLIPLAVWARRNNKKSGRNRSGGRGGNRRNNRGGGFGFGGGGSGRRSSGGGMGNLFGGGGSGRRTSGARSGGLGLGGGSGRGRGAGAGSTGGRRTGGAWGAGAGAGRGRGTGRGAGLGLGGGRGTGRRAGAGLGTAGRRTGGAWGAGRNGAAGTGRRGLGRLLGGGRNGAGLSGGRNGVGTGGRRGAGIGGGRNGAGLGGGRNGGAGRGMPRGSRPHGWTSAVGRGARKPTAGQAFRKAARQYGKNSRRPTLRGAVTAGLFAGGLRALRNPIGKVARSLRQAYTMPNPEQVGQRQVDRRQQRAAQQQQAQQARQQQNGQHPVPQPAYGPNNTPNPASAGNGQPTPAGTGHNTGGTDPMYGFPGRSHAVDFYAACAKWAPQNINGAIWDLHAALPGVCESIALITNGYSAFTKSVASNLGDGLEPAMADALAQVYSHLFTAFKASQDLVPVFAGAYAADIERAQRRGSLARNVRV